MPDTLTILNTVAQGVTALGVGLAWWQLRMVKRLAQQQFEDQLGAQYRELIRRLPAEALLGEPLTPEAHSASLTAFIHYFDLSNEQTYLHRRGRISTDTWRNWQEGIDQHLKRPAFAQAWAEVSARAPDSFDELRALLRWLHTTPTAPLIAGQAVPPALPAAPPVTSNPTR